MSDNINITTAANFIPELWSLEILRATESQLVMAQQWGHVKRGELQESPERTTCSQAKGQRKALGRFGGQD